MTRSRRILILTALGAILTVAAALYLTRALWYGSLPGAQEPSYSALKLDFEFYIATAVKEPAEEPPPGYQFIDMAHLRLLARTEPDLALTEKDVKSIELPHSYSEGGLKIFHDDAFVVELENGAAKDFVRLAQENIGRYLVIVLNGDVAGAPQIVAAIRRGRLILPTSGMSKDQRNALLSFCEQTSVLAERPEVIPGTGRIVVKARFNDGTKPLGADCLISTYSQKQSVPESEGRRILPTVTGGDGDWVIYNISEGAWAVEVRGDDFAWTREANMRQPVEVRPGKEELFTFTLLRGGSVSGRVVYAHNGQPVPAIVVSIWPERQRRAVTDDRGRYTIRYVAPGTTRLVAYVQDYVPARSEPIEVKNETTVSARDIRLRRGGWISGQVVRPQDAPEGAHLFGRVHPHFEAEAPQDAFISYSPLREDDGFRFRLGPLPPGSYSLEAWLGFGKAGPAVKRWRGEVTGIRVEVAKVTENVVIKVSPTAED